MNKPQDDLFRKEQASHDQKDRHLSDNNWYFVTNHKNLQYILAAGLIMSPRGFGNKYYEDPLRDQPGWIPVFANTIPLKALEQATKEQQILQPVVLELNLSAITGKVFAPANNADSFENTDVDHLNGDSWLLFIPAPLPTSFIKNIYLQSIENKKNLISEFKDVGNISAEDIPLKVKKPLFNRSSDLAWPITSLNLSKDYDQPLFASWTLGGVLALLSHLANLGQECITIQGEAFSNDETDLTQIKSSLLTRFIGYSDNEEKLLRELFWGAADKLTENQKSETPKDARGIFLEHIKSTANNLDNKKKQALLNLAKDLDDLARFPSKSIGELLQQHQKTFSRTALLFFMRKNSMEFLRFRNEELQQIDYMAAAILFAARDGWINLSSGIRNIPGLSIAVSHRMAAYAHQFIQSGLHLGSYPPRPQSLRELFQPGPKGWRKAQKEAALLLTRDNQWQGILTRITLGKGKYELLLDGRGMNILVDGEVKAVESEVEKDQLFNNIAQYPASPKSEQKARELLIKRK